MEIQVKDKSVVVVAFPDSQEIENKDGFLENCALINSEKGLEEFGGGAYKVNRKWYDKVKAGEITDREYTEDELVNNLEMDYETDWF